MSLLEEIRKQPEHIRRIMMWLCVVVTFSLVAFVWFRSTQTKFVALLRSNEAGEEIDRSRADINLFVEAKPQDVIGDLRSKTSATSGTGRSLFASISDTFSLLKASLLDLIGSSQKEFEVNNKANSNGDSNGAKILPLSEDR